MDIIQNDIMVTIAEELNFLVISICGWLGRGIVRPLQRLTVRGWLPIGTVGCRRVGDGECYPKGWPRTSRIWYQWLAVGSIGDRIQLLMGSRAERTVCPHISLPKEKLITILCINWIQFSMWHKNTGLSINTHIDFQLRIIKTD